MKISQRLALIVCLTVLEVSFTVWTAFELAKGADFHRLNFLHLKYQTVFSEELRFINRGRTIDPDRLAMLVSDIRQQPVACLAAVNGVDRSIMRLIRTDSALETCQKDVADADSALNSLALYVDGKLARSGLLSALERAAQAFVDNSNAFELPIARTVEFLLSTLIPLIIGVSFLNIATIAYLSRTITLSLRGTTKLLAQDEHRPMAEQLKGQVSGELRELLEAAEVRIKRDFQNREMNTLLEREVAERTASLTQANDELAQFAYRASHDLKAPLSSTKGLSQLIGFDIADGNLEEASLNAERITRQMDTLERLVVDILALARADLANDQVVVIRMCDIVSEVMERHAADITAMGMHVEISIEDNKEFKATRIRLVQIVDNLVSNAIRYYNENRSKPRVSIIWRVEEDLGVLTVQDNGRGIPSNRRGELFEMFKRFHPEVAVGSGLGLAIVKKHVDKMNAKIACDSSEVGTRFVLEIASTTSTVLNYE